MSRGILKLSLARMHCRHEDVCAIVNNDLLHSIQLTHQIDSASNHSHRALFVVDSLPQIL